MVDVVLLEWEGVLADTGRARRGALRVALAAEGVAHCISDSDEQLRGLGVHAAARAVLRHIGSSDAALADLIASRAASAFAAELARGLVLMPGASAFVACLQQRARVALVTRAGRAETEQMLRMAGLEDAMTTIISADDAPGDTPSAQAYELALGRLALGRPAAPMRALAIVDSLSSIRAARRAGVRVLTVGAPAHEAVEADAAIDTLEDLTSGSWSMLVDATSGEPRHE